jgi:histidine triad (HIT) family protein
LTKPDCVFDSIVAGDLPAHLVLEEAEVLAFLDARPVFPGHTLVVPRRHHATVADLPLTTAALMWGAAARVAAAQRAALGCDGTFFGLNDVVSQSVPHCHLHVVPRRRKDGLRGFFWPRTRYADEEEAARVAAALRAAVDRAGEGAADRAGQGAGEGAAPAAVRVAVRDAEPGDLPRLVALLAAGSLGGGEDPARLDAYGDALAEVRRAGHRVLVAEVDGALAGMCQVFFFRHLQHSGGRCAELESVHVDSALRGRGIGAALVSAAVEAARDAGCYRVQLTSNKARTDAHRFWARQGFAATHEGFKRYL